MRPIHAIVMASALAGTIAAAAVSQGPAARDRARAERILEGRTAGQPVSCVSQRLLRGNQSLEDGGILFGGNDPIVYVNRPPGGCPTLDSGRILITRTPSSQLCRGDIVTVRDSSGGPEIGSCGLGDFTPYRRAG